MAFARLTKYLNTSHLNQFADHLELLASLMLGRGVLDGLDLTYGSGFTVVASAGAILADKIIEFDGGASGTMPAESERFVFIDADGVLSFAATDADPGGTTVCLGSAVSDDEGIVSVSTFGRWQLMRQRIGGNLELGMAAAATPQGLRANILSLEPFSGTPEGGGSRLTLYGMPSGGRTELGVVDDLGAAQRLTEGGKLLVVDPVVGGHIRQPVEVETLTSDKTLGPTSANVQVLTPSGANRAVRLPSTADFGMTFRIVNPAASGGYSLLVKSSDGSTTVATVAPQEEAQILPTVESDGSSAWPELASSSTLPSPVPAPGP